MKDINRENKLDYRVLTLNLVTTWIAVIYFFYDEGLSSGRASLISFEMVRVFLTSGLSVLFISYFFPRINDFLFGVLNIITSLMLWSILMGLLLLIQGEKLTDLSGIILVAPTALFLFYSKFFICYLIMTVPLFLYKKLSGVLT